MRKVIYVLVHGSAWKVQCEHCNSAVYNTQAEAIRVARQHVASLPGGTLAQIRIQHPDGRWREEWTYGKDPYPPKG